MNSELEQKYAAIAAQMNTSFQEIEVDEDDTSEYETRVERMFDNYDFKTVKEEKQSGDKFKYKMAREFAVKSKFQKFATVVYGRFIENVTGRQVTYPD